MLAIRMQRTGRRGHAQFRLVVQDSHFHPTRGRVVAYLGSYDPHAKVTQVDKELAQKYLSNGAQPSDRVANLLKSEGVKLPDWVKVSAPQKRSVKNPDKRRSTRPAEAVAPVVAAEAAVEEVAATEPVSETPAEPAEETPAEPEAPEASAEVAEEAPAKEPEASPEAPAEEVVEAAAPESKQ